MSIAPGTVTKVRGNTIEFQLTNGKTIKIVAMKLKASVGDRVPKDLLRAFDNNPQL